MSRGGLPLGIDFSGGTIVVVKFDQAVSEQQVRGAVDPIAGRGSRPAVRRRRRTTRWLIRLPQSQAAEQGTNLERRLAADSRRADQGGLPSYEILSREIVGPVIGADLQRRGIYATLASILAITVYIALPLPVLVRHRRHCRDVPRHPRHAGVPGVLRLRPVAEHRRRHADDYRLLGERHDRHLRPRPREPALDAAASRSSRSSTPASTRRCRGRSSRPARRFCRCCRCIVFGGEVLRGVRVHDARRHRQRHVFDGLHRVGHRDHAEQAEAVGGGAAHAAAGRSDAAPRPGRKSRGAKAS